MAYSRKNHLLRVKDVCELYEQVGKPDVPMTRTYHKHIYPRFHISRCTFYRYLSTNYKKELRHLAEKVQPKNPKQYTLFD